MPDTLFNSDLESLTLVNRGKVRDIYAVGDDHLLILTSDRLSAFDVVLPTPIPGKGAVLTAVSNFWFERTGAIIANHLAELTLEEVLPDAAERRQAAGRAIVVRKLRPLPAEAIVRGYLAGSGWKDYQRTGALCGIALPDGLRQADKLAEPLFTPSTKAELGAHDENISFARMADLVGRETAEKVRAASLAIYTLARDHAETRGIIVADTKFEFGLDEDGALVLIDEVVTPDSSRFWPIDSYAPGSSPPSFDKQFVRDYLERIGWDKKPPAPELPAEIVAKTAEKYREAQRRLVNGA
ncbi:MAG: phosphoribosylaminoimidazolesuccinocarboxamide synthase [Proteobacteria bacterium]|nr:phosphoribosylaminoimidazolesuccinocarboxamide synthase [Pseudomonadota bacterium]